MDVYPVRAFTDNYIWMLVDDNKQSALCVDPGEAGPVIRFLEQPKRHLDAILLTHHHNDHIGGLNELLNIQPKAQIYGPVDARILPDASQILHQKTFTVGPWQFQVLSIPGHTSTHICFYETGQGLLFCGDTLFSAGCGRVFDGSLQQLHDSLALLKTLPDETRIYCGHEYTRQNLRFAASVEPDNQRVRDYYHELLQDANRVSLPSTMSLEKQINPFLRLDEPAVIAYAKSRGCHSLDSLSVFKQLREDKNTFS